MASGAKNTAAVVRELLEEKINGIGYSVWDVEYVKEGPEFHLRITIDSSNGIDILDCEKVHHFVDPLLDEDDPIESAYVLEISSPGVERDLRIPEHFTKSVGESITLKLFKAHDGQKVFTGKLVSYDVEKDVIGIEYADKTYEIERDNVAKANIYFEF